MSLSINTDIVPGSSRPFLLLKKIAEKGYEFIEWNQEWNTDYFYTKSEIEEIKNRIKEYNIKLNSLHASIGVEKQWFSENDYQRKGGVELVKNRIEMTAELGGDVIILHPFKTLDPELYNIHFKQGLRSLKDLKEVCKNTGVKIALENLTLLETFTTIEKYFDYLENDFMGFCWDTGHSNNIVTEALDYVEKFAGERLIALHLNDNEGDGRDLHKIPFYGTVDWDKTAKIIAASSYSQNKPLTLELNEHKKEMGLDKLLETAMDKGLTINEMVKKYRK